MNNINQIIIERNEYPSREEFENAIKKAVMVLLDNNYIMTVRYDEKGLGIVAIDFESVDMGGDYPYWLSPEEIESVVTDEEREEMKREEERNNEKSCTV